MYFRREKLEFEIERMGKGKNRLERFERLVSLGGSNLKVVVKLATRTVQEELSNLADSLVVCVCVPAFHPERGAQLERMVVRNSKFDHFVPVLNSNHPQSTSILLCHYLSSIYHFQCIRALIEGRVYLSGEHGANGNLQRTD